jgi:outer membrane protein OmpA-like peptidoglycan-associated protein
MFQPAGNYLYAVGTDYYPKIIKGGSAYYDPYNTIKKKDDGDKTKKQDEPKKDEKPGEMKFRDMKVTVKNSDGMNPDAEVEVRKWDKGRLVYQKKYRIKKPEETISVPDTDDVEITADSDGYVPKKVIVSKKDEKKDIILDKIEKGRGIVVENIYFETNEAYLKKESLNILERMTAAMKKNGRIKLEVRGHTDSTGTPAHNKKLSERRADAVVEYMIKNGISPDRLKAAGLGATVPIDSNKTREGRKKNRRTEFFVLDR